jgi:hypothetical protein
MCCVCRAVCVVCRAVCVVCRAVRVVCRARVRVRVVRADERFDQASDLLSAGRGRQRGKADQGNRKAGTQGPEGQQGQVPSPSRLAAL